jgi:hypothetical protein
MNRNKKRLAARFAPKAASKWRGGGTVPSDDGIAARAVTKATLKDLLNRTDDAELLLLAGMHPLKPRQSQPRPGIHCSCYPFYSRKRRKRHVFTLSARPNPEAIIRHHGVAA